MKHLTLFICTLGSGGAEHQMSFLANFLCERNYEVDIVTFGDIADHYPLDPRIGRTRIAEGKSGFAKAIAIFRYFLREKTDYVISFTQRANALMLPATLFRPSLKVIAGERNCTIGEPDFYEKLLFRVLYKKARWIVPNSYSQESHIRESQPGLASKLKVITNYTDTNEYIATPVQNSGVSRVGVFCRYAAQKNYERFLVAMDELNKNGNLNFEVHWYGSTRKLDGWNPDYLRFCELVEKYGLTGYVFAHDSTQEVAKEIEKYDVLCLPSLFEGFSNSLSEYICCGRPVLASDVSDNSLMVKDGENGFLFNPEDVSSIVSSFKKFYNLSDEERARMGIRSREIAETLFNKEHFIDSYISLIES